MKGFSISSFFLLPFFSAALEPQALFLFQRAWGPTPKRSRSAAPRLARAAGASYCTRVSWPRTTPPPLFCEWKFT